MTEKKYNFATYYRVLAVTFILICHFTQESENSLLEASSQFFNIGVDMFIILSGFLFGGAGGGLHKSPLKFYKKRLLRIYLPFLMFVLTLFIIDVIKGVNVLNPDWILFVSGVGCAFANILGAGHTWFITVILFCYLITPALSYIFSNKKNLVSPLCAFSLVIPAAFAPIPFHAHFIFTMFSRVSWYIISYYIGKNEEKISLKRKTFLLSVLIFGMSIALRLTMRRFFDGTVLYNQITAGYTHMISAFSLFNITAYLTRKLTPKKVTNYIAKISFEIYLYHNIFCVGPVKVFGLTGSFIADCLATLIISLVIASIANFISSLIVKTFKKRKEPKLAE